MRKPATNDACSRNNASAPMASAEAISSCAATPKLCRNGAPPSPKCESEPGAQGHSHRGNLALGENLAFILERCDAESRPGEGGERLDPQVEIPLLGQWKSKLHPSPGRCPQQ